MATQRCRLSVKKLHFFCVRTFFRSKTHADREKTARVLFTFCLNAHVFEKLSTRTRPCLTRSLRQWLRNMNFALFNLEVSMCNQCRFGFQMTKPISRNQFARDFGKTLGQFCGFWRVFGIFRNQNPKSFENSAQISPADEQKLLKSFYLTYHSESSFLDIAQANAWLGWKIQKISRILIFTCCESSFLSNFSKNAEIAEASDVVFGFSIKFGVFQETLDLKLWFSAEFQKNAISQKTSKIAEKRRVAHSWLKTACH